MRSTVVSFPALHTFKGSARPHGSATAAPWMQGQRPVCPCCQLSPSCGQLCPARLEVWAGSDMQPKQNKVSGDQRPPATTLPIWTSTGSGHQIADGLSCSSGPAWLHPEPTQVTVPCQKPAWGPQMVPHCPHLFKRVKIREK